ncbi:MAG: hypothetical protein KC733_11960 [Candidatus Omnitrophica bacterium]|nr:hypothetical protein [Candidatus Omnitrophota bacterium]
MILDFQKKYNLLFLSLFILIFNSCATHREYKQAGKEVIRLHDGINRREALILADQFLQQEFIDEYDHFINPKIQSKMGSWRIEYDLTSRFPIETYHRVSLQVDKKSGQIFDLNIHKEFKSVK